MPTDDHQDYDEQAYLEEEGIYAQLGWQFEAKPSAADIAAVLELVHAATVVDGVAPLSEEVLLEVRSDAMTPDTHVLLWHQEDLVGYAFVRTSDKAEEPSGELVIHPAFRRKGLGLELLQTLVQKADGRGLRVWAHGELPAATALAASAGLTRVRSLWQLRRSLTDPLPAPRLAEGITIRTFAVGQDEDAWTELNRLAFAHHPEQGRWTRADLQAREDEDWFDPAGFFLAERDGRLAGFHWTKVHPAADSQPVIGEVYVVGVDPAEQGSGLGRALTLIGLQHLRDAGLDQVMLYVDEENTAAIRLYESLGFERWSTDAMFRAPSTRGGLRRKLSPRAGRQAPRRARQA